MFKKKFRMKKNSEKNDDSGEEKFSQRLETVKILTDEDWEKIEYIRKRKPSITQKRKYEPNIDDEVDLDRITGDYMKKRRISKEERESMMQEKRSEMKDMKRDFSFAKRKKGASSTNIQKRKSKPYAMLRHKALKKLKRSARQKRNIKEKHTRKLASQKLDHH